MFSSLAKCVGCGAQYPLGVLYTCETCGNILDIQYDYEQVARVVATKGLVDRTGRGIWRYRPLLPVHESTNVVSLGEGGTELLQCDRLASELGLDGLFIKDETREPTGSFKDRPIAVATTKALEFGVDTVVTSSSGNAGAAVAAYAAKAGLRCVVVVPSTTSTGKLTQMVMCGAEVISVDGSSSDAFRFAQSAAKERGWLNISTTFLNPYPIEGNKTVAYEMAEQLGWRVPDWVIVPIGAGPLLVGIFKGFEELNRFGLVFGLPRMVGVQAEGCAPIFRAFEENRSVVEEWTSRPATIAGGIADPLVGYRNDGTYTLRTIRRSGGLALAVSDEEIMEAAVCVGKTEGLFVEPTAAAAIAGAKRLIDSSRIQKTQTMVCLVTGHGLKDTSAFSRCLPTIPTFAATEDGLREALSHLPGAENKSSPS
ncbi:MAG: threonine synthase [Bacillota bacterium]